MSNGLLCNFDCREWQWINWSSLKGIITLIIKTKWELFNLLTIDYFILVASGTETNQRTFYPLLSTFLLILILSKYEHSRVVLGRLVWIPYEQFFCNFWYSFHQLRIKFLVIWVRIDFKFSKPKVLLNLKNDKTFSVRSKWLEFPSFLICTKRFFLKLDLEAMIQKKNRVPPCISSNVIANFPKKKNHCQLNY